MRGSGWNCPGCNRPVFRWVLVGEADADACPPFYAVVKNGKVVVSVFDGIVAECTQEDCLELDYNVGFRGELDITIDELKGAEIVDEGSGIEFEGEVTVKHKCGEIMKIPKDLDYECDLDKKHCVHVTLSLTCTKCKEPIFSAKGAITDPTLKVK